MAKQSTRPLSGWRDVAPYERLLYACVGLLLLGAAVTLVMSLSGTTPWHDVPIDFFVRDIYFDPYFIFLYTTIAVLFIQNVRFFYSTREPLYLTYCLYITFMSAHIVVYERIFPIFNTGNLIIWSTVNAYVFASIGYLFIFQFARQLLNTATDRPRADLVLKAGALSALVPSLLVFTNQLTFVQLTDLGWTFVFGSLLIFITGQRAFHGDRVALVFCASFVAQYVAVILSLSVELWTFMPLLYEGDTFRSSSAIYISGLALEAFLMSFAAHLHSRGLKDRADAEASRADKLERAVQAAQVRIAEMAEIAIKAEAASQSATQTDALETGPKDETETAPTTPTTPTYVADALRDVITTNAAEPFVDVTFLTKAMAMSEATLARRLKGETGTSPSVFIRQVRLDLAKGLLTSGEVRTVGEALLATGFTSQGHFARHYKKAFGETPVQTLKAAHGA